MSPRRARSNAGMASGSRSYAKGRGAAGSGAEDHRVLRRGGESSAALNRARRGSRRCPSTPRSSTPPTEGRASARPRPSVDDPESEQDHRRGAVDQKRYRVEHERVPARAERRGRLAPARTERGIRRTSPAATPECRARECRRPPQPKSSAELAPATKRLTSAIHHAANASATKATSADAMIAAIACGGARNARTDMRASRAPIRGRRRPPHKPSRMRRAA